MGSLKCDVHPKCKSKRVETYAVTIYGKNGAVVLTFSRELCPLALERLRALIKQGVSPPGTGTENVPGTGKVRG